MPAQETRLDSWKAIAHYLGRDERTVQRWEADRGLPVHRLPGAKRGGIFAYPAELDLWMTGTPRVEPDEREGLEGLEGTSGDEARAQARFFSRGADPRRRPRLQTIAQRTFLRRPVNLLRKAAIAAFFGRNCGAGRASGSACPILDEKFRKLLASRRASGGRTKPALFQKPTA
jgi:hypothetical protein